MDREHFLEYRSLFLTEYAHIMQLSIKIQKLGQQSDLS
jgi:hypothetical protein